MLPLSIYHTVTCGLYLHHHNTGILIDGIHTGQKYGFSDMPPALLAAIQTGQAPFDKLDALLFTHLHPDHFNRRLLAQTLERRTDKHLDVYGQQLDNSTLAPETVAPGLSVINIGTARVILMDLIHDGPDFKDVPNQSLLVVWEDAAIFVAGDSTLTEADAQRLRSYYQTPIDAAFLNAYQLGSRLGHGFIRKIAPRNLYLYHLPFEKDDQYGIYTLSKNALRRFPDDLPRPKIPEHMAWIR